MALGTEDDKKVAEYFNNILDVLSDGIYISDHNGKTLQMNHAYEQLTGLKKGELVGRLVKDLIQEGKYDVALNPDIVRTGKPKTSVQVTKLGRQVILNGYPVFDRVGKVALVVTFVRDVTLLSQLKEELAYQQELIARCSELHFQKKYTPDNLIVASKEMHDMLSVLNKFAKTDATIMLLGETGVGKDILARKIHEHSSRSQQPFFKVDCTTIPPNLVESELFGYEPGAFSGANTKGKPGYFEMANKGTLFLDEIGELPLAAQAKLLRVLQDHDILRIGSTKLKKIDVRFVAATNRNLEDDVKHGTFRSDLFYRLKVAVIKIPALRDRKGDIIPLASHFLQKFNVKYRKDIAFTEDVMNALMVYKWPGNIREMENMIQSLVITTTKDVIDFNDLPNSMVPSIITSESKSLGEIMDGIEKDLLKKALEIHGSVVQVAKIFKVDRTTIFRKMRRYGLHEE